MGIETVIASSALLFSAKSYVDGQHARADAAEANRQAAEEQTKANNEKRAQNYAQQAEERRNQLRQERIQRAKILQASENTGAAGSSGESGALGSMNTQLQANIGMNLGMQQSGNAISGYMQNAANFNLAAQQASMKAQSADSLFGLGMSIFQANGGFGAFKSAPKKG